MIPERQISQEFQFFEFKKDIDVHIELDIDAADAFDYEDLQNAKYSVPQLEQMLIDQVVYYDQ